MKISKTFFWIFKALSWIQTFNNDQILRLIVCALKQQTWYVLWHLMNKRDERIRKVDIGIDGVPSDDVCIHESVN